MPHLPTVNSGIRYAKSICELFLAHSEQKAKLLYFIRES